MLQKPRPAAHEGPADAAHRGQSRLAPRPAIRLARGASQASFLHEGGRRGAGQGRRAGAAGGGA